MFSPFSATATTTTIAAAAATTTATSSSSSVFTSLNDKGRGKDGHYSGEMFVCVSLLVPFNEYRESVSDNVVKGLDLHYLQAMGGVPDNFVKGLDLHYLQAMG